MSFFIVSSSSPNSALLSLIELTAVRQDCLSLYSSMSRGFNWCHRALNLSSSCWKACTLDSTLLFITSTFKDYSNNYCIVLERIFTLRNDIMSCTVSHSFKDQKTKCSPHRVFLSFHFSQINKLPFNVSLPTKAKLFWQMEYNQFLNFSFQTIRMFLKTFKTPCKVTVQWICTKMAKLRLHCLA